MTLRKNVASQDVYFVLIDATTGGALTGAAVTAKRSIDNGAQAACTGTITEDGNGQYHLHSSAADTNGDFVGYLFYATGSIPVGYTIFTTGANPTDGVRLGLTALPNVAAAANGGLPTVDASNAVKVQSGTGANQISLSSGLVSLSGTQTFNMTGNITGNLSGSVGSVTGNVGGNVVGSVGSVVAAVSTSLSVGERNALADAMLNRDMSVGTDSGSPTFRTMRQALRFLRNKWVVGATTLIVYKEDDTTQSWDASLTVNPTAAPITGSDPAS